MGELTKKEQLALVQEVAAGSEAAKSKLLQYVTEVLPLGSLHILCEEAGDLLVKFLANPKCREDAKEILIADVKIVPIGYIYPFILYPETEVLLVRLLANPDCREVAKEILIEYEKRWMLRKKAQVLLIKLLANQNCKEVAREILLGHMEKVFYEEAQVLLVEYSTNPEYCEAAKEILIEYVKKWMLCKEAQASLINLLANPDCREAAKKIMIMYVKIHNFYFKVWNEVKSLAQSGNEDAQDIVAVANIV